jgi:hypothetical protein
MAFIAVLVLCCVVPVVTGCASTDKTIDEETRLRFVAAVDWVTSTQHMPSTAGFKEPDCVDVSSSVIYIRAESVFWGLARGIYGAEELEREPGLLHHVGDSLRSVDKARKSAHFPYMVPSLNALGSGETCEHVLFFSEPFDDRLMAEVLHKNNMDDPAPDHKGLAQLATGYVYLFKFDGVSVDTAYVDFINYD